jgi:hypothetical protein
MDGCIIQNAYRNPTRILKYLKVRNDYPYRQNRTALGYERTETVLGILDILLYWTWNTGSRLWIHGMADKIGNL